VSNWCPFLTTSLAIYCSNIGVKTWVEWHHKSPTSYLTLAGQGTVCLYTLEWSLTNLKLSWKTVHLHFSVTIWEIVLLRVSTARHFGDVSRILRHSPVLIVLEFSFGFLCHCHCHCHWTLSICALNICSSVYMWRWEVGSRPHFHWQFCRVPGNCQHWLLLWLFTVQTWPVSETHEFKVKSYLYITW
jgi:hypothetical protein